MFTLHMILKICSTNRRVLQLWSVFKKNYCWISVRDFIKYKIERKNAKLPSEQIRYFTLLYFGYIHPLFTILSRSWP